MNEFGKESHTMPRVGTKVQELYFDPIGSHNSGQDVSSATTLTIPNRANKLMIQTHTQNVRFTLDGTVPTVIVGFQLMAGDPPTIIPLGPASIVKVIEEDATAALQYQFGR